MTVATAGCMVGPDYVPPELRPDVEFRDQSPSDSSLANVDWWEFFADPALLELIEVALEENKDLQVAYWRMEAAQARYGFTRADLFPGVEGWSERDLVAATIAAETQSQLDAADKLLTGETGKRYHDWADELATMLALVEAGVDFTDQEDVVPIASTELAARLEALQNSWE